MISVNTESLLSLIPSSATVFGTHHGATIILIMLWSSFWESLKGRTMLTTSHYFENGMAEIAFLVVIYSISPLCQMTYKKSTEADITCFLLNHIVWHWAPWDLCYSPGVIKARCVIWLGTKGQMLIISFMYSVE